jgi:uncharacterized protein (TIGR03663 family)
MQNEELKQARPAGRPVFASSFFILHSTFILIALLALAVRLPRLADRPMHTDEAVNGYVIGQLLAGEAFHYDNQDHHGPTLYALALPLARLAGAKDLATLDETTLRLGPVIVGALTVLLFSAGAELFGVGACLVAALLFAFAPLPVFYSRYFIHETLFVAATFGFLLAGWRWLENRSLVAAGVIGLCAGLMLASKETAVLSFAAAGAAVLSWWVDGKNVPRGRPIRWSSFLLGVAGFLIPLIVLFSWGGRNWRGVADLTQSFPHYFARAGGHGHDQPVWYYLTLLGDGWSGWPLLALAVVGSVGARRPLLVYTLVIGALYSFIPYKTPWLALNIFLPLTLLAGCGVETIWRAAKSSGARGAVLLGAVAMLVLLAHDTRRRVFAEAADERNPYVYGHTSEDILNLPERLKKLSTTNATIAVIAADPWPVPWYLRAFPRVGYWQPGQAPGVADYFITSPEVAEQMKTQLTNWRPEFFGVRPGVLLVLWTPPEAKP